jgi:lipopolysaccharide/colanic/teichoic acid biosynthesis glycosyltransferase
MVVLSPVMLLVWLAIKLDSPGPAIFRQKRLGLHGKEFTFLKYRSMTVGAEFTGSRVYSEAGDPRVTKVGKFIRATRLDELPQLLNILKGDMSVVGPRPERMSFIEEFCKEIPEFAYRTKVKAGLTGYAQIYGKYNTCPYDKLRMDLMYIEHYSLQMDIKLIIMTIRIIFSKESTEGIDKAEENQKKVDALLDNLQGEETCAEDLSVTEQ